MEDDDKLVINDIVETYINYRKKKFNEDYITCLQDEFIKFLKFIWSEYDIGYKILDLYGEDIDCLRKNSHEAEEPTIQELEEQEYYYNVESKRMVD